MEQQKEYEDQQLENFGKRLKYLRKKAGYNNYELFAFENGLGRSQYGRYEKGSDIRLSTLMRVIKALDMTPAEFFSEGFELEEDTNDDSKD